MVLQKAKATYLNLCQLPKLNRAQELAKKARLSHHGVYLTGPNEVKVLEDDLPVASLTGENYLLASFGNCRCASDAKAIRQFDAHARVPSGVPSASPSGHETLQLVLEAPSRDSNVEPGDVVVVTPGHATEPIDPIDLSSQASDSGVLSSHWAIPTGTWVDLRQFSIVPGGAPAFVKVSGLWELFQPGQRQARYNQPGDAGPRRAFCLQLRHQ